MFVRPGLHRPRRPCVVLAHSDTGYVGAVERAFRQNGWMVCTAGDAPQARRLAREMRAELVVMEADMPGESGWLVAAKMRRRRVVLVTDEVTPQRQRFAAFVDASLVARNEGAAPLLDVFTVVA